MHILAIRKSLACCSTEFWCASMSFGAVLRAYVWVVVGSGKGGGTPRHEERDAGGRVFMYRVW